jgi:hypothetical protein
MTRVIDFINQKLIYISKLIGNLAFLSDQFNKLIITWIQTI